MLGDSEMDEEGEEDGSVEVDDDDDDDDDFNGICLLTDTSLDEIWVFPIVPLTVMVEAFSTD